MFDLANFWGRHLSSDVRDVQKEIADQLREMGPVPSDQAIRDVLEERRRQCARDIGRWPLQVYRSALYAFVLNNDPLVSDTLRQCHEDSMS